MLILKDISLNFQNTPLFAPLTLEIGGGDICVLSAPSGAGKSTLLRWVAGIPTEGLTGAGLYLAEWPENRCACARTTACRVNVSTTFIISPS
jgi:ABC-type uncharacterized transport system YnjBCD ATPase subunit